MEEDDMAQCAINVWHLAVGIGIGDSVSINGVCLTVNEMDGETLIFYAMPETLRRTALEELAEGDLVNLERAMTLQTRFGGDIVEGQVDGFGEVGSVTPEEDVEIWVFSVLV